jgi:hypothetical protein
MKPIVDLKHRVVSIGGVGSSALLDYVENYNKFRISAHQDRKHTIHPSYLIRSNRRYRFLFLIGNPYNAVLSVFRRKCQWEHERCMSFGKHWVHNYRDYTRYIISSKTGLKKYLKQGVDAFNIMDHVRNWVEYEVVGLEKIMILKYEFIPAYTNEIASFFNKKKKFNFVDRHSNYESESDEIKAGLFKIYGEVKEYIDSLPAMILKEKRNADSN